MERPATTHISLTDARRDLLATVADYLAGDTDAIHPLVANNAALAFRELVAAHDAAASRAAFRRRRDADLEVARAIAAEDWAAWEDDRLMEAS